MNERKKERKQRKRTPEKRTVHAGEALMSNGKDTKLGERDKSKEWPSKRGNNRKNCTSEWENWKGCRWSPKEVRVALSRPRHDPTRPLRGVDGL